MAIIHHKDDKKRTLLAWSNDDPVVDDGLDTLTMKIYDHINYKLGIAKRQQKGNLKENKKNSSKEKYKSKLDEHGCVAYQPPMPPNENQESQQRKKERTVR